MRGRAVSPFPGVVWTVSHRWEGAWSYDVERVPEMHVGYVGGSVWGGGRGR